MGLSENASYPKIQRFVRIFSHKHAHLWGEQHSGWWFGTFFIFPYNYWECYHTI